MSHLYPPALREAAKKLNRRPLPDDFPEQERIVIWMQLKTCIRTLEHRLKLNVFRRSHDAFSRILTDLQDHYVDFSISLGADDVYSLTEFAQMSE